MDVISASPLPAGITSPTIFPSIALARGETYEIDPLAGSASSSPTIRKVCSRPSSRTMVTVAPNRTSEMSPEAGTSCALARRALQYLISRAAAAIDARSDEAWADSTPPGSIGRRQRKPASRTAQGGVSRGKSREWKLPIDKPAIAAAFPGAANLEPQSRVPQLPFRKTRAGPEPKSASPVF